MKFRSYTGRLIGGIILSAFLLAGCASKNKVSVAAVHVAGVEQVLSAIGDGVRGADADALSALWSDAGRDAARMELVSGLGGPRVEGLEIALVGVRVEGERTVVQATWNGHVDGEPAAGRFGLLLTGSDELVISSAAGELPWAVGGRGAPLSPDWPVKIGP